MYSTNEIPRFEWYTQAEVYLLRARTATITAANFMMNVSSFRWKSNLKILSSVWVFIDNIQLKRVCQQMWPPPAREKSSYVISYIKYVTSSLISCCSSFHSLVHERVFFIWKTFVFYVTGSCGVTQLWVKIALFFGEHVRFDNYNAR